MLQRTAEEEQCVCVYVHVCVCMYVKAHAMRMVVDHRVNTGFDHSDLVKFLQACNIVITQPGNPAAAAGSYNASCFVFLQTTAPGKASNQPATFSV